ncbi:putative carboxylesterase 2 [Acorus calamus]|uniref:Carboxylesterase 2 n=1 Tax=Acorus calamus TaxID=4465 RepID=A0AAV9F4F8_ACOCL|nr:putative carboxylesterase 2 [Acorus calamus]
METTTSQKAKTVIDDLSPFFLVYDDGTIERLLANDSVPPSLDPLTAVTSKDALLSPNSDISARLYLPNISNPSHKLPLLIYVHGGGFCLSTTSSSIYHNYLNRLSSATHALIVSVDYRRAPEHLLPTAYEDSWAVIQWAISQKDGGEPWLAGRADFEKVFLAGDSAGANIAHNLAMRAGKSGLGRAVRITGLALVHPYFWGSDSTEFELADPRMKTMMDRIWAFVNPNSAGSDDPLINPIGPGAPSLAGLGCERVLVCVAGKDTLRDRGRMYYEALAKSGWGGEVSGLVEMVDEGHCFHLFDPNRENSEIMLKRLASFINGH